MKSVDQKRVLGLRRNLVAYLGGASALAAVAVACGASLTGTSGDARVSDDRSELTVTSGAKVGLLFASHGDIDDAATELEPYIKTSFQKNVGIPLPSWSRDILTNPAYALSVRTVRAQYDQIGATRYKGNSQIQADLIEKKLQDVLPGAKVYLGYNFTAPLIEDTMAQMRRDGIETIVVMNKGAQFSYASSGENLEDVLSYLDKNPGYDAEILGVLSYSEDPRFVDALAKAIDRDAQSLFPGVPSQEICVLMGSHGLPTWLINRGDSAIKQMEQNIIDLREALPQYPIYHGYLNDDFFPGAQWVAPKAIELAPQLVTDKCQHVLMDGRLSFTTHHRATLYDLNVEVKELIETNLPGSRAVLAPNFDDDANFAEFIANLTKETLELKGKSVYLKKKGEKPLAPGTVASPGVVLETVTHLPPVRGWKAAPTR
jgi:ferrochelatase